MGRAGPHTASQVAGLAGNGTNGEPYTSCISLAGSHIQNVRIGAILAGNNLLFTNNVIDHFGDDGIDYAANNLAITHNTLHDNLEHRRRQPRRRDARAERPPRPGRRFQLFLEHPDRQQPGRPADGPAARVPDYLQGIDAFDEDWTNVTVTNNVVVTSACPRNYLLEHP